MFSCNTSSPDTLTREGVHWYVYVYVYVNFILTRTGVNGRRVEKQPFSSRSSASDIYRVHPTQHEYICRYIHDIYIYKYIQGCSHVYLYGLIPDDSSDIQWYPVSQFYHNITRPSSIHHAFVHLRRRHSLSYIFIYSIIHSQVFSTLFHLQSSHQLKSGHRVWARPTAWLYMFERKGLQVVLKIGSDIEYLMTAGSCVQYLIPRFAMSPSVNFKLCLFAFNGIVLLLRSSLDTGLSWNISDIAAVLILFIALYTSTHVDFLRVSESSIMFVSTCSFVAENRASTFIMARRALFCATWSFLAWVELQAS